MTHYSPWTRPWIWPWDSHPQSHEGTRLPNSANMELVLLARWPSGAPGTAGMGPSPWCCSRGENGTKGPPAGGDRRAAGQGWARPALGGWRLQREAVQSQGLECWRGLPGRASSGAKLRGTESHAAYQVRPTILIFVANRQTAVGSSGKSASRDTTHTREFSQSISSLDTKHGETETVGVVRVG